MSIFTRFGIESTNVEHILTTSSSWYQVLIIAKISFCAVQQSVYSILRLIIAHRFSIGLRSGEFPGQLEWLYASLLRMCAFFWKCGTKLDPAGKSNHHQQSLFPAQETDETAMLPCICHCSSYFQ